MLLSRTLGSGLTLVAAVFISAGQAASTPEPENEPDFSLERALDRSGRLAEISTLPDGTTRIDLKGTFQHATMVRMDPDGVIRTFCTEHPEEAHEFLKEGQASNHSSELRVRR